MAECVLAGWCVAYQCGSLRFGFMANAEYVRITMSSRCSWCWSVGLIVAVLTMNATAAERPLSLHRDNPHYFSFRGKPTIIVTSGEHYGAVLNLDFDYVKYLRTLGADG